MRSLTLPDIEPIRYDALGLWNQDNHDTENSSIHTMIVGAARLIGLDQLALDAYLYSTRKKVRAKTTNKYTGLILDTTLLHRIIPPEPSGETIQVKRSSGPHTYKAVSTLVLIIIWTE